MKFQFPPLREGRQHSRKCCSWHNAFQFPPLREGRLVGMSLTTQNSTISIPAPPRGATGNWARKIKTIDISIPAPPRGATLACDVLASYWEFQFPPLREGRPGFAAGKIAQKTFQFPPLREGRRIPNAPLRQGKFHFNSRPSARGDGAGCCLANRFLHFNSRPSARGDRAGGSRRSHQRRFQFPPLREGRRAQPRSMRAVSDFNSRPSARGDRTHARGTRQGRISIPAPPRGATALGVYLSPHHKFQFPPLREGRLEAEKHPIRFIISIPAPPRGATRRRHSHQPPSTFQFPPLREGRREVADIRHRNRDISIPAPPRGATRPGGKKEHTWTNFNSRPSARGDQQIGSTAIFRFY